MLHLKRKKEHIDNDQKFIEAVYAEKGGLIYYHMIKEGIAVSEQEDIIQEVMLRLVRNVGVLKGLAEPQLVCYIVATVRTVIIDRGRSMVEKEIPMENENIEQMKMDDILYEHDSLNNDSKWDVEKLRNMLPERDWLLLEGKYLMGYSQEELAKRYGCAPDSVRMLLTRVRKKAREILKGEE